MADHRRDLRADAETYAHRAITSWLPVLYLLISSLFFLRTYDSAQVKISMMQMGGLGLLTMWLARLAVAGRHALNREDLVCLSPFLAYLGWGVFSYLKAPYHMSSTDFFLRHMFYMIVALITIYEFDEAAVGRLFKILIWTAWIAIGYGTLQFIDNSMFPRGVGKGIDPFVWRGAFSDRVFSTYGNPNFYGNFLVIMFPILLTQWFKTRRWSLIVLIGLLLLNLIKTGTKGAWLGFAMVCFIFGVISLVFFAEQTKPFRKRLLGLVAVLVLGFVGYTAKDLMGRVVSINFRLFTWEATWEMIRTQPWTGSGVGSFPPLYPAFRRPAIFHIEGKHNTETDHAENEYLEQFFDNGILGFGIFIWLVLSTLVVGFRSLGQLTATAMLKDGRPPPRALDLIGVIVAFMGMLAHNTFDVSMRFVSSGVYLGLLSGLIVNLARGKALYELHAREAAAPALPGESASIWATLSEMLIWPLRLAAAGGVLYYAFFKGWAQLRSVPFGGMFGEFAMLQGPLARVPGGGELLQWWLAWGVFAGCMLWFGWKMIRLCLLSENPVVPLLVLAMLAPLYQFWGYFKADIHHNVAIYFSKERQWEPAVGNYLIVNRLNPDFVMSKYFLGNVFNDRFSMTKAYLPNWGDTDNVARDDYERAMYWYEEVRKLAPNYVQMHHQIGNLHLRRAEWATNNGRPEEAEKYLDMAMTRFRLYYQIDPVFAPNFYRMAQIHMIRKQYDAAARTYQAYIDAAQCAVAPSLLEKPWMRKSILSYQHYAQLDGAWAHRHVGQSNRLRESAEAYASLANALFMGDRFPEAEQAYRIALSYDQNFEMAKKNLEVTYRRAQADGRLKPAKVESGTQIVPGVPVPTGWLVVPKK
ncbi:MAG: O-antigen ligase family protein [Elusimicrobia bacterium]|nr:O-antigen ligase family protein [Elusimicrobiota bacterium]